MSCKPQIACKQQICLIWIQPHMCRGKKKVFKVLVWAWLALLQQHAPAIATDLDASVCMSHKQCIVWKMRLLRNLPSEVL